MAGLRPPLVTKGQMEDIYGMTTLGAGALWLIGGIAAGPAALALAACGVGAIANRSTIRYDGPKLDYAPPDQVPRPIPSLGQNADYANCERLLEEEL